MMSIVKVIGAFVLVAMLGSSFVAYTMLNRADTTGLLVLQSHRALEAAEETLRRAVDAESAVRGYVLSRDHAYLVAFERAEQMIQRPLDALQNHVGGEAEARNVRQLRVEVGQLFVSLRNLMIAATAAAGAEVMVGDDAALRMNAIRAIVREVRRTETERLAARMAADAAASRSLGWVAVVAAALAAALATVGGALAVLLIRPGWGRRA